MDTIWLIEEGRETTDYHGRDDWEYVLDQDYGFYTTQEAAQAFCDAEDEKYHRGLYQKYLDKFKEQETVRRRASEPYTDERAEKEYQVLLQAGLREPRSTFTPRTPDSFEDFVEKITKPGSHWNGSWQPRYKPVKVENAE